MKMLPQFVIGVSFVAISACGGSGSGGGKTKITTDTITINMSPLRVVGFSDDTSSGSLYPIVFVGDIANGETLLMRVRDPFEMGDFYSIRILNGYGGFPAPGAPTVNEGEPDNSLIEAAALTWGDYLDRGLDPLLDEDWFSFTSSGECCSYVSTIANVSGAAADPILEIYNPSPNPGPITYTSVASDMGVDTFIAGIFDPANNLTFVLMDQLWDAATDAIDINSFFLIFTGPPSPGDYQVRFATPPFPDNAPGSVTGSIHVDEYDKVGGRIIGSFDITIADGSRTTTISGNFNVTRVPDEPGLLTGFRPGSARAASLSMQGMLKGVSTYMRRE
jgi:hypothetical protein